MIMIKISSLFTLIQAFICMAFILSGIYIGDVLLPVEKIIYPISVLSVFLLVWSLWSWLRITEKLFSPYPLFLISSNLFLSGHTLLYAFGLTENILGGTFTSETILQTQYLILMCHSFLHLGALLAYSTRKKQIERKENTFEEIYRERKSSYIIGWILFGIALIPTIIYIIDSILIVSTGGYFALYQQDVKTGFNASSSILVSFIVPAAIFMLVGSKFDIKKGYKIGFYVSTIFILLYTIAGFFLGARSSAALPLIAFLWAWHKCIKPIPKIFLLIGGSLLMLVLFPVIAMIRNNSGNNRVSFVAIYETFTSIENPLISILTEMGNSMNTVAYSIELIPNVRDFDFGISYLYSITTVFPNLFWNVHPAVSHGTLSNWLVWTVDPIKAKLGGGLGYSYTAEAYANFGLLIAPIFVGLIGFLFIRFILWSERDNNTAKIAMVASFLAVFLFFPRDESISVIRPLVWCAFAPYIGSLIIRKFIKVPKRMRNENTKNLRVK